MSIIKLDQPGKELLLMGNEAVARGALEGGVKVAAAYPGTPSSEIIASLVDVAQDMDLYVEWSINEKVALEVTAAAAFSGLRTICAMKQNGLNVASDFLLSLNLMGIQDGALVLITCDDPSAHSSNNEQDSRLYAKMAGLPLLEPATFQEAKEMTRWALEISERIGYVCMMRGVTRISHARGNVTLGELPPTQVKPHFDKSKPRVTMPALQRHKDLYESLGQYQDLFERSAFNRYDGPQNPELLIITCGSGWLYSQEAVEILGLEQAVGILKIGTTWPLPQELIVTHLTKTDNVLIIEEIDPFLEGNVKEIAANVAMTIGPKTFFGKHSQHIPFYGEMNTDRVIDALQKIMHLSYATMDPVFADRAAEAKKFVPGRALSFCPGCPHRASLWSIKNALQLDNREGFVTGDIGCYALGRIATGFSISKTNGAMGTGTGLASGFGKLGRFGFNQPVISLCGDSTFFHAAMPALANASYNRSNLIMVILDNSATAMTGFQPHPGVGNDSREEVNPIAIEGVCRAFGASVTVADPFNLQDTKQKLLGMLQDPVVGAKVLILQKKCALLRLKEEKPPYRMQIDAQKCLGEDCGCNRYCTRVFKCPGLVWEQSAGKARIDDVICVGCGVCGEVCPQGAILREELN